MSTYTLVIVLPGTTGSTLVDGKSGYAPSTPYWPDQILLEAVSAKIPVLNPDPAGKAATMLESSTLYAGIVSGWTNPDKGYGSLAAALAAPLSAQTVAAQAPFIDPSSIAPTQSYPWGLPSGPLASNLVIGFAYDWRQDNRTSARMLQNLLYNLNATYGAAIGNIHLVSHSMGGIVSRTYLEVLGQPGGANDPLYNNIASLTTLGTPHLGAPLALEAINGTLDVTKYLGPIVVDGISVSPVPFETMVWDFVDNTKYPSDSTYELLPPPAAAVPSTQQSIALFITDQTTGTTYSAFDPLPSYIQSLLQAENLDSTDLANAQTLLGQLGRAYTNPVQIPYYCIYGVSSAYPTCTGLTYTTGKTWSDSPTDEGGDQIVPIASAQFSGAPGVKATYQAPGSVNHLQLPGNPDVQQQIINWLNLGH